LKFIIALFFTLVTLTVSARDTVTLVIPTGPGGLNHKYALELEPVFSKLLDKTVVIDFKPGANGLVAAQHVADSKSKELVFLLSAPQASLTVDQLNDIKPVLDLGHVPTVLVARSNLGVSTLKELVTKPPIDKIAYGVPNGAAQVYYMKGLAEISKSKVELFEVPYKSGSAVLTDVAGGHLDTGISSVLGALPFKQDNKLVVLAVLADKRSTLMPDVPTAREQGVQFDRDFVGFTNLILWANPNADISKFQKDFALWAKTDEARELFKKIDLGINYKTLTTPDTTLKKILNVSK
jgi:tripartite-type tricarboxylate transporter receptor subunit TctC